MRISKAIRKPSSPLTLLRTLIPWPPLIPQQNLQTSPSMSTSTPAKAREFQGTNRLLDYQSIISALFTDQDPAKAIALTLARGDETCYSYWESIRKRIIRDERFRADNFLFRLRQFKEEHFSPQDPQWALLEDLATKTLREQYAVERCRKPFLKCANPALEDQLKKIKCLNPLFYDYVLPREAHQRQKARRTEKLESRHVNSVQIELGEMQRILSVAKNWREYGPVDRLVCALILSGRRVPEVLVTMRWEPDPENRFRAVVWGMGKDQDAETRWTIPILCDYTEFDLLMQDVRSQLDGWFRESGAMYQTIHRADVRVFGTKLNHSMKRAIYSELAFRERHVSQFMVNATKMRFVDAALAHECSVADLTISTYQAYTVVDERV